MNACLFFVTTFTFVCKETNYLFLCSDAKIQPLQRVRQCVMMRIVKALKRDYSVLWPTRWDSDCLSMGLGLLFQVGVLDNTLHRSHLKDNEQNCKR